MAGSSKSKTSTNTTNSKGAGRRRVIFSKEVVAHLKDWLEAHLAEPYPTEADTEALSRQTGLSTRQVLQWFINARRRNKVFKSFRPPRRRRTYMRIPKRDRTMRRNRGDGRSRRRELSPGVLVAYDPRDDQQFLQAQRKQRAIMGEKARPQNEPLVPLSATCIERNGNLHLVFVFGATSWLAPKSDPSQLKSVATPVDTKPKSVRRKTKRRKTNKVPVVTLPSASEPATLNPTSTHIPDPFATPRALPSPMVPTQPTHLPSPQISGMPMMMVQLPDGRMQPVAMPMGMGMGMHVPVQVMCMVPQMPQTTHTPHQQPNMMMFPQQPSMVHMVPQQQMVQMVPHQHMQMMASSHHMQMMAHPQQPTHQHLGTHPAQQPQIPVQSAAAHPPTVVHNAADQGATKPDAVSHQ